jgi:two-component system response regulator YesN
MQQASQESLGVTLAVTLCADPCGWNQLAAVYDRIRSQQHKRAGDGVQLVLTVNVEMLETAALSRSLKEKAEALAVHLEGGRKDGFLAVLEELTESAFGDQRNGGPIHLELYYSIALSLFSYINRWELHDKVGTKGLMQRDMHASWQDSFEYLKMTAETIFDLRLSGEKNRAAVTIEKVRSYIGEHIGEDLSLVRLAGMIHFNPSYLSRLFKQECGVNLSEYIDAVRMERAKELLKRDELKIAEVGARLGYETHHSFTRFFKKSTGVTPLEYRESFRK